MNDSDPLVTIYSHRTLIQAVPHLAGYRPGNAIAVLGVVNDRLRPTLVLSLSAPLSRTSRWLASVLRRERAEAVYVVGYGPAETVTPAIDGVRDALAAAGIEVAEAMRVTGDRFWSYTCLDAECCPAEGTPTIPDPDVEAQFVFEGSAPAASRDELVAKFDAITGAEREAFEAVEQRITAQLVDRYWPIDTASSRGAIAADGVAMLQPQLQSDELPGPVDITRLGFYLRSPRVRETAVAYIETGTGARDSLPLWIWLTRHLHHEPTCVVIYIRGMTCTLTQIRHREK